MLQLIYELRKNWRGWTGGRTDGWKSKALQEVLADLKTLCVNWMTQNARFYGNYGVTTYNMILGQLPMGEHQASCGALSCHISHSTLAFIRNNFSFFSDKKILSIVIPCHPLLSLKCPAKVPIANQLTGAGAIHSIANRSFCV